MNSRKNCIIIFLILSKNITKLNLDKTLIVQFQLNIALIQKCKKELKTIAISARVRVNSTTHHFMPTAIAFFFFPWPCI